MIRRGSLWDWPTDNLFFGIQFYWEFLFAIQRTLYVSCQIINLLDVFFLMSTSLNCIMGMFTYFSHLFCMTHTRFSEWQIEIPNKIGYQKINYQLVNLIRFMLEFFLLLLCWYLPLSFTFSHFYMSLYSNFGISA